MFTFFDFMYYLVYKWYTDNNDSGSEGGGCCAVAGFQTFNILSIIWLYEAIFNEGELYTSKLFVGSLIGVLIILNYIRYIWINRFTKEAIQIKWESKSLVYQKDFRGYLTIYISTSLIILIAFMVYFARKRM